jgi:apolipoprotein N-acyltransferase
MALAFPKTNASALAPLGAVGLFWACFGLSPRRALFVAWAAGVVFFSFSFSWFGETAGSLIAPFGFLLTLGPAVAEAFLGFALVGALVAYLVPRCKPSLVPLAAAAAFAFAEWVRSEGLGQLGVPFASLGYTQVETPLAPLAAFAGTFGITLALCIPAAYVAYALRFGLERNARPALAACAGVVFGMALAWTFWPARSLAPAKTHVAAIQGNIAQSLKFDPSTFNYTLGRYVALTQLAGLTRPAFVVWPETVITAKLNGTAWLRQRFGALARQFQTTLIVGSFDVEHGTTYNALYFFGPNGEQQGLYRKRQLVPFAEHLPFATALSWIPWTRNIGGIGAGPGGAAVFAANGALVAPVICWESAFSNLVVADVRRGAQVLIVSTDDAWFGTTAGPYQHAQISQMRALETGRWIVRAAATGVSGIISPNGRFTHKTQLDVAAAVTGSVGPPVETPYDRYGSYAIAALCAALVAGIGLWGKRSRD